MFRGTLQKSRILRDSIDAIAALLDEGTFTLEKESISLLEMDPAHVALIDFMVNSRVFENFELDEELNLRVEMKKFDAIMKRIESDASIEIMLNEEGGRLELKTSGEFTRKFFINLVEPSEETYKIPDIHFTSKIKLHSSIISEIIKDISTVKGEDVLFRTGRDFLHISSTGEGGGVEARIADDQMIDSEINEGTTGTFSKDYLDDMIKGISLADTVELALGVNTPLKMSFRSEDIRLIYMLAPKIEA